MGYNKHSKKEDALLLVATQNTLKHIKEEFTLPDGYTFEWEKKISYEDIYNWHISNGYPEVNVDYLLKKNPSGKYAAIKPDGGIIIAIKKDSSGNIERWVPILTSEAKHQESEQGNAIERGFKNANVIADMYSGYNICPYIMFVQGNGFSSEFEKNKLRGGLCCNVYDTDAPVDIHDERFNICPKNEVAVATKSTIEKKHINCFVRPEPWTVDEMSDKLNQAAMQACKILFERVKDGKSMNGK